MIGWRAAAWMVFAGSLAATLPVSAGDDDGPKWHSEEWYAERAGSPPGTRQKFKYGKAWPPYARPVGKGQPFWHKYHTAHYWPHPYNCEDREYLRSIITQQTINGWDTAMTLHDYHFDQESNRLNSAGERHLTWILLQSPQQYRAVYVSRGSSEQVAQFRLNLVQETAQSICGSGLPPILLKYDNFIGRPAIEIDTLRRLELQAIPQPRLFMISAGGAGSSDGPSSSQAGGSSGLQGGSGTGSR